MIDATKISFRTHWIVKKIQRNVGSTPKEFFGTKVTTIDTKKQLAAVSKRHLHWQFAAGTSHGVQQQKIKR